MCIMCAHQKPMVQEVSSASPYEQLVSRSAALGHRPREAGRCREAGKGVKRMKKGSKKKKTHSTIGTVNRNFFVGVYWSPLSICSHMFRLSYAPALNSKGMP